MGWRGFGYWKLTSERPLVGVVGSIRRGAFRRGEASGAPLRGLLEVTARVEVGPEAARRTRPAGHGTFRES